MSVKKYLTLNGLTYFLNKIKTYVTSSTYLNSIGISNSDIDDIADDAGYSSGSLPASEDIFITGDIIPNTDNSVDLGASSKNIKMIYTKGITINGTQFLPSEFVNVSSNQTIGGVKTFSDIPIVANGKSYVSKINANRTNGTQTDFSPYNGFKIVCNNDSQAWNNTAFAIHITEYSPTVATIAFKLFDCIEGGTSYKGFLFRKNNNDFQFSPTGSNSTDLGTSTHKWKSFNGIAPDELGLPTSTYTNVSSYITNFDGVTPNHFTAPVSGLLYIQGTGPAASECTVNNGTKGYNVIIPYGFGCIRGLVPVEQGDEIYILTTQLGNLTDAKIYHLKGKV